MINKDIEEKFNMTCKVINCLIHEYAKIKDLIPEEKYLRIDYYKLFKDKTNIFQVLDNLLEIIPSYQTDMNFNFQKEMKKMTDDLKTPTATKYQAFCNWCIYTFFNEIENKKNKFVIDSKAYSKLLGILEMYKFIKNTYGKEVN